MSALFANLMNLCGGDTFFFADQTWDNRTYRIFNYHLASYSDFLLPDALEARGIMFDVTDITNPFLVCRPMRKFFNLNECPFTMGLNVAVDNIDRMEVKSDGSLISTFLHATGETQSILRLKSKGSLTSSQAVDAANLLNQLPELKQELEDLASHDYTVNMEYVAPHNRIVLNYQQEQLIILNVRCNQTGKFVSISELQQQGLIVDEVIKHWTQDGSQQLSLSHQQILDTFDDLTGIEGFVVYLKDGHVFKMKTPWYCSLHRSKECIDTPRRLFEAVINEASDDLRAMMHDNPYVLNKINEMETFAKQLYNKTVSSVENFVTKYNDLICADNRKQYAISAQQELDPHLMGLAMTSYDWQRGKAKQPVNYKEFLIKGWKKWGLKDESASASE